MNQKIINQLLVDGKKVISEKIMQMEHAKNSKRASYMNCVEKKSEGDLLDEILKCPNIIL